MPEAVSVELKTETATKEVETASPPKLSLKEMLKENFVILHCRYRNSPIINLILVAWEYYGSKSKKIHVKESVDSADNPKLEYENGKSVEGPAAIVTYLLLLWSQTQKSVGSLESSRAQTLQWIFYALNEVKPPVYSWVTEAKGYQRSKSETLTILGRLNEHLLTRTYLVGERISCADISMATVLLPALLNMPDKSCKASYLNVFRWINTCLGQQEFIRVLGSLKLN